jgi:mono/diheme cytochrome c family protein
MRARRGYPFLLLLCLALPAPAFADSGKELFERECAGCHTLGGGDSAGPDLKGVAGRRTAAWLERVIVEPDKLAADKDPVQLELVKRFGGEMPNLGVSRHDARKIVAFLQGVSPPAAPSGAAAPPAEPAPAPAETVVTPELVARGKALFTGAKRFANGGAPCSGCHAFGISGTAGGALAVDLSDRIEAAGERGFRGMLKSLNFPIMRQVYADRPLTEEEIDALVAFSKDAVARKAARAGSYFPTAGVAVFACMLAGLALYKRRIR